MTPRPVRTPLTLRAVIPARAFTSLALAAAWLTPTGAAAQMPPLVVEVRTGAAAPFGSFADGSRPGEGADPEISFGVDFTASGGDRFGYTLGFSQHRFGCRDAGCAPGDEYVATGVNAGLRLNLRTGGRAIPWLQAQAITTRVELDPLPDDPGGISDIGFGGEVGFGVHVGLVGSLALNPAVRVSAINTELPGGTTLRMRYVVAGLGLVVAF